jgi:hypothetical protein
MNTLKMKIVGFEGDHLLVKFASDETRSQNPDDYETLAFQPFIMWPDVTNTEEIIKRVAQAGSYHAHQQAMRENAQADQALQQGLTALIGTELQYAHDDLFPAPQNPDNTPLLVV